MKKGNTMLYLIGSTPPPPCQIKAFAWHTERRKTEGKKSATHYDCVSWEEDVDPIKKTAKKRSSCLYLLLFCTARAELYALA